jgi:hypothetical protein
VNSPPRIAEPLTSEQLRRRVLAQLAVANGHANGDGKAPEAVRKP